MLENYETWTLSPLEKVIKLSFESHFPTNVYIPAMSVLSKWLLYPQKSCHTCSQNPPTALRAHSSLVLCWLLLLLLISHLLYLYSQTINVNYHFKEKPSSSEYTMLKQKADFSACAPLYKQEEVFLKLSSVEVDIWYVDGPRKAIAWVNISSCRAFSVQKTVCAFVL